MEERVRVGAPPSRGFAWLDDPRNTGWHMSRRSLAMAGGLLRVEQLSQHATGQDATYRSSGRMLGLRIDFTTTVVRWIENREKVWRTVGNPHLAVIGQFERRLAVDASDGGTRLTLSFAYDLPASRGGRVLGWLLAGPYARWCVLRIIRDVQTQFGGRPGGAGRG
jgi:hypothetical protein